MIGTKTWQHVLSNQVGIGSSWLEALDESMIMVRTSSSESKEKCSNFTTDGKGLTSGG